jgi:cation diffusion facilitator CzcD-associated flavoprotein CzcO
MNDRVEIAREPSAKVATDFDAIVIGAGVSSLYQLYRLRELNPGPISACAQSHAPACAWSPAPH